MITSKLTTKAQTVMPKAVRQHLGVGPGDELEYELIDGAVVVRPLVPSGPVKDDPFQLFDEWNSQADDQAYDDL